MTAPPPHLNGEELDQVLHFGVGREAAGLGARVAQRTVDGDVELAGFAGAELDADIETLGNALLLETIPHPEGLRLVASSAAILDQHLHGPKVVP